MAKHRNWTNWTRFDFQVQEGKMEHPRLVSVAEHLVPDLLKPKSQTGGKLLTKLEQLKARQKRGEGKEEGENGESEEAPGKALVKQPNLVKQTKQPKQAKQKQMVKDQINRAKPASNGKKSETNVKRANRTEVDKTPTGCAVVKKKQAERQGELDLWD